MQESTTPAGFLLINKPEGISSFSIVAHIKRLLGKGAKVGHAGTLDPFATGLLILAVGRPATREISHFMKLDKVYQATGKLGELTNTLDKTGTIIATNNEQDIAAVTLSDMQRALSSLGSEYEQKPPIFSALKYKGQPLYALARKKQLSLQELDAIAATKGKLVSLYELTLLSFEAPFFTLQAHVSHGTYIRSLVDDVAAQLGLHATTYALERVSIGPFQVKDAHEKDCFSSRESVIERLISIEEMMLSIST